MEFVVDAGSELLLSINWNPEETGGCRETVTLKSDQICRLQFVVIGIATNQRIATKKVSNFLLILCQYSEGVFVLLFKYCNNSINA